MSSPYGSTTITSSSCPTDFASLQAQVAVLNTYVAGLQSLQDNQVGFGELISRLTSTCDVVNLQAQMISTLQEKVYKLENEGSPTIISVAKTG